MQFSDLYTTELDRALGSSSTQLFTVVRRKAAINAAQLEWVNRTECLIKETDVSLSDGTQEYDLEASITDFFRVSKQGIRIAITSGSSTTYIEGDDLKETTVERLNHEQNGWRGASAGSPRFWYLRRDGGRLFLGLSPKPDIAGSDTWVATIPYLIIPADLSADSDVPFTVSSNALTSLKPWHHALAYYASAQLEEFRKDQQREAIALQKWEAEIGKFLAQERPKQGQRIRLARDYRRSRIPGWQMNPRARG